MQTKKNLKIRNALLHIPKKTIPFSCFITETRYVNLLSEQNYWVTMKTSKYVHEILLSLFFIRETKYHYISEEISFRSEFYRNPPVIKTPYILYIATTLHRAHWNNIVCIYKQIHVTWKHSFLFSPRCHGERFHWN